ncbi:MAG: NUDIX domain-containing protein [Phycisphaerae bacterium]|nr:NUDIX domain-containing protein [Phycisphaerae bacterium]
MTTLHVAVAAVWRRAIRDGQPVIEVLAARRHARAIRGGLWELPGGKMEPGETADDAARREVAEETGICLIQTEPLGEVEHHDLDPDKDLRGEARVRLHAVLAQVASTVEAKPIASAECRWVPIDEFDRYDWPPANAELNSALVAALRER